MSNVTGQIEDAVLSAIEALKDGQPSGYLRTARSYSGNFAKARVEIALMTPAALVRFEEAETKRHGGVNEVRSRWTITVVDNSAYGEESRRRGITGQLAHPGTYKILSDIRGLLDGQTLVTDTAPLRLVSEGPVKSDESASVMEQVWETVFYESV